MVRRYSASDMTMDILKASIVAIVGLFIIKVLLESLF